jgi:predicted TIM-barrel fold metal-dependent hydrolase
MPTTAVASLNVNWAPFDRGHLSRYEPLVRKVVTLPPSVALVVRAALSLRRYSALTAEPSAVTVSPVMLLDEHRIVSVDDHIIEHSRVWLDRMPAKYLDACPRVVELPLGHPLREGSEGPMQQWYFEGHFDGNTALSASAGTAFRDRGMEPQHFDDIRPGAVDPVARLADMDADGIWAELNFPNYPGFAGRRFQDTKDPDLGVACVRAWNDFALDEWAGSAPDRYIPLVIVPFWNIEEAVRELERGAAKGARTFSFPDNPANIGLPSFQTDHWDALWSVAEDTELPVCMHFGSGGIKDGLSADAPMAAHTSVMGSTLSHSMVELCLSPVFHRHPGLKVVYSEGQVGWMPFFVQRMDQVWDRYRFYRPTEKLKKRINADVPPSELFKRHIWGCFIDDAVGLQLRHQIGIDKIMFEADFPHDDSHFPNTRSDATKAMADISDDEVKLIVEDNARKLFRFAA